MVIVGGFGLWFGHRGHLKAPGCFAADQFGRYRGKLIDWHWKEARRGGPFLDLMRHDGHIQPSRPGKSATAGEHEKRGVLQARQFGDLTFREQLHCRDWRPWADSRVRPRRQPENHPEMNEENY